MTLTMFEKANQIIKNCDTAYLGVIDENGYPSVSTISVVCTNDLFTVYFSTDSAGNKMKRIQKNSKASVCFKTDHHNITLVGDACIVTDQETKNNCWMEWFINHYPGGQTDPNYVVIKLTTKRVSLWIDNESAEFLVDDLLC